MEQINKEKFDELLKGEKPVVCDFYADWCGPCKMLAPVMEDMSGKFKDSAEFVKVNVDNNPELSVRYGIMSIPSQGRCFWQRHQRRPVQHQPGQNSRDRDHPEERPAPADRLRRGQLLRQCLRRLQLRLPHR